MEVNPKKQHKRTKKMRTVENSSPKREVRFVWRTTTESDVGGKKGRRMEERRRKKEKVGKGGQLGAR